MNSPPDRSEIGRRLAALKKRIGFAMERAGRSEPLTLVAVTKAFPAEVAVLTRSIGQLDLGESRPQELRDKAPLVPSPVRWHFIGPLQRNKVKYVVGVAELIHSIDSLRLAEAIERRAEAARITQDLLVQVDLSGDSGKQGVAPGDIEATLEAMRELPRLRIRGLMTMPAAEADLEESRAHFRELARLSATLRASATLPAGANELSMGMTRDFEVAIDEGATIIRVGTAIFGPRIL
ncbi:MAG: YggS family pyridoxal phosphate-dependent enzyme [Gemmatimonadetes bacterium]|nr:YggS family pyridoxal phosphate-dependent enzyme [Gemmatimonadota bacterium]